MLTVTYFTHTPSNNTQQLTLLTFQVTACHHDEMMYVGLAYKHRLGLHALAIILAIH